MSRVNLPYVESKGLKIHYQVFGRGPTVVLLHGWCNDSSYWLPLARKLKSRYQVVVCDLRGHGLSSAPAGIACYRSPRFVSDLRAIVQALGIKKAIFVGHSLGAAVLTAFSAQHPDAVRGLILAGADLGFRSMTAKEEKKLRAMAKNWAHFARRHGTSDWARGQIERGLVARFILGDPKNTEQFIARYARQPLNGFIFIAQTLPWLDRRLAKQAVSLSAKTFVLIGTRDLLFYRGAKRSASQMLNCELIEIKNGEHDLMRSMEKPFVAAVLKCVTKLR